MFQRFSGVFFQPLKNSIRFYSTSKMYDFNGKTVIVTGSSAGIGQSTAVRFAKEGANVTIHGRNPEGIEETKQKLSEIGVKDDRIQVVFGDMVEDKTLHELIDKTIEKFGQINVVVNNAGGSSKQEGYDKADISSLDHVLELNLKSVMKLNALALPHLEKTKGTIVNVSSVDAHKPHPEALNYAVAKSGLDAYTRNACCSFAEKGVRINNLNPGWIRTEIKKRGGTSEEGQKKFEETWVKKNVPLARSGLPHEMANIIVFLASEEASFMTGSLIIADGGLQNYSEPQGPAAKTDEEKKKEENK
jgi:NAD(P)-dependent dehydrogenase (short-subunit alcohol dehydrogenase family)